MNDFKKHVDCVNKFCFSFNENNNKAGERGEVGVRMGEKVRGNLERKVKVNFHRGKLITLLITKEIQNLNIIYRFKLG